MSEECLPFIDCDLGALNSRASYWEVLSYVCVCVLYVCNYMCIIVYVHISYLCVWGQRPPRHRCICPSLNSKAQGKQNRNAMSTEGAQDKPPSHLQL